MQLVLRRLPRTLLRVHAPAIPKKLPAFGAALFAVLTLVSALPPSDPTVRVAGTIGLGFKVSSADRMVVDSSRHRGYYVVRSPVPTLWMLDLKGLRVLRHKPLTLPDGPVAVDSIRHKIFFAETSVGTRGCASSAAWVLDGVSLRVERVSIPCDPAVGSIDIDALSMDAPHRVLTLLGHRGTTSIVRELTVSDEGISLNWEIEQTTLCSSTGEALIARMKHGTAAYCTLGSSGRTIWIPTWHGLPVPDAIGRPIVRTAETGPVGRVAALDRRSGRAAITRGDDSVAVYDAPDERRVATLRPPTGNGAEGIDAGQHAFDPVGGRLYLFRDGVLHSADVRGNSTRKLARFEVPSGIPGLRQIAVDSRLHRLFVPEGNSLIAVQDDRLAVDLDAQPGPDRPGPDRGASDIAHPVPQSPTIDPDSSSVLAVIPSVSGKAAIEDRTTITDRLPLAVVEGLLDRSGMRKTRPIFPTSPFLVARSRHTRILLRAPPAVM